MLIFWKERLVFLATPKTGSTSIEMALESLAQIAVRNPPQLKHIPARKYRKHLQPLLEGTAGKPFTSVALMREPIDWLGSWYRYRQRDNIPDPARSTSGMSFETAIEGYLSGHRAHALAVGSQARFLTDGALPPAVDRVFRYEAIDQFLHFLEDRLNCEITLPRLNVSPKAALTLSPEIEKRLRIKLADDYRIYDSLG